MDGRRRIFVRRNRAKLPSLVMSMLHPVDWISRKRAAKWQTMAQTERNSTITMQARAVGAGFLSCGVSLRQSLAEHLETWAYRDRVRSACSKSRIQFASSASSLCNLYTGRRSKSSPYGERSVLWESTPACRVAVVVLGRRRL